MISTNASTTTSWWICIFLCAGFFSNPTAGNAQTSSTADALFAEGKWQEASLEYERSIYHGLNPAERTIALLSKAECLKRSDELSEAASTLTRVPYPDIHDTLAVKARYQSALVAYLRADFKQAESEMLQMAFYTRDTLLYREYLFLKVLVLNEQGKWKEAHTALEEMIIHSDAGREVKDSLMQLAGKWYSDKSIPRLKKAETAQKWATFLPGSGHIYAGYVGEGIMNFALQAASLGMIGYHIYISHFFTAFTVGSGLFQHFYFGGINRVQFLVEKRNYKNKRAFNEPMKLIVLDMQQRLY